MVEQLNTARRNAIVVGHRGLIQHDVLEVACRIALPGLVYFPSILFNAWILFVNERTTAAAIRINRC